MANPARFFDSASLEADLRHQEKKPGCTGCGKALKNLCRHPENLTAAASFFKDNCVLCHGEGQRMASAGPISTGNLYRASLIKPETDGGLFWR